MTIRITDNLLNRPLSPGGQSDGTESVTRQFGNQTEQFAKLPSVPDGWGGVANRYAGMENNVRADIEAKNARNAQIEADNADRRADANIKASRAIVSSVTNTLEYMDSLRTAEEDSRSKRMFLEIDKRDAEVRARLDADPEYAKLSTADQQSLYETERDLEIDKIHQGYGFKQAKVVRNVEDNLAIFKAKSSENYLERVVKPRVVAQSKINDAASDSMVIDKVAIEPTPENIASAAANISERYASPIAYATYGAAGANALMTDALKKLEATTLTGFQETLENSPLANLTGPAIDTENFTSGTVAALIADQKLRASNLINQLPIPESERLVLVNKAEKYIDQYAKASVSDHNKIVKEAEKERKEQLQSQLDTWEVSLSMSARNGALNQKQLFSSYQKLIESPEFKDDPDALKRAYKAFDKVDSERTQYVRQQERLASDRKTRETIAEMRMSNGIAVSATSAEQVFKKNGTLKSFIDGGQVVSPGIADQISKAGAVPPTILSSITTDLGSSDPKQQQRGVRNLQAIKGHSSAAQRALLRDLPDEYAGVINRMELGQSPQQALSFLTRPRATPDVEKKLKSESREKSSLTVANTVMKDHGWAPDKMSSSLKEKLNEQWEDAYVRSGGDKKLAADLFRQDLAKNKRVGKSDFTGKVEPWPTSNYASKQVVTEIINRDLPETKGKEVVPVYNGMIIAEGKEVPTYRVYVVEDGMHREVTKDGAPFYMTDDDTTAVAEKLNDAEIDKQVKEAEKRKAKDRAAELRGRENANALGQLQRDRLNGFKGK